MNKILENKFVIEQRIHDITKDFDSVVSEENSAI